MKIIYKKPHNALSLLFLFLIFPLFASLRPAQAEEEIKSHQFHLRTGDLSMSISGGGLSKSYSSSSTLDLEYETLNSSRSSNIFRAIIAIDSKLGKAVYTFMGVGKRYYFLNSNGLISHVSGSGFDVEVVPARRFYYGFDAGFATGLVTTLGAQLETTSYMLDGSLCVGYIRQMSKSIAFDAQLGMGMAYGFTGASATAQTQRILLGMIYSF